MEDFLIYVGKKLLDYWNILITLPFVWGILEDCILSRLKEWLKRKGLL